LRKDGSILFTIGGACRSAIPGTSGVAAVNGAIQSMAFTMAKEIAEAVLFLIQKRYTTGAIVDIDGGGR
jgi:hypothetical protein